MKENEMTLTPEQKVSVLERVLLSIYGGKEIKYTKYGEDHGYLTIVDVPHCNIYDLPNLAGYEGEGLSMNYEAETFEDSFPKELGITDEVVTDARLNLEIWWWCENLWDQIKKLKKEIELLRRPKSEETS